MLSPQLHLPWPSYLDQTFVLIHLNYDHIALFNSHMVMITVVFILSFFIYIWLVYCLSPQVEQNGGNPCIYSCHQSLRWVVQGLTHSRYVIIICWLNEPMNYDHFWTQVWVTAAHSFREENPQGGVDPCPHFINVNREKTNLLITMNTTQTLEGRKTSQMDWEKILLPP